MKNFSRAFVLQFWAIVSLCQLGSFNLVQPLSVGVANAQDSSFESKKIVPFVPSPQVVVDKMVELVGVKKGDVVFDQPATHMFEVGRFRQETMAFPPGVTVKDYTWGGAQGYPNPKRGKGPEHFPTIIMIVPTPSGQAQK